MGMDVAYKPLERHNRAYDGVLVSRRLPKRYKHRRIQIKGTRSTSRIRTTRRLHELASDRLSFGGLTPEQFKWHRARVPTKLWL
jgi:hypothetical protein